MYIYIYMCVLCSDACKVAAVRMILVRKTSTSS